MENKITDVEVLNMIKDTCSDNADIVAYCDKILAQKAAKAVKARERAAKKREMGDELRGVIASVLTKEPMIAEQVLELINGADLTKAKVISRLTQLVKLGTVVKADVIVDGKKRVAYSLAD